MNLSQFFKLFIYSILQNLIIGNETKWSEEPLIRVSKISHLMKSEVCNKHLIISTILLYRIIEI